MTITGRYTSYKNGGSEFHDTKTDRRKVVYNTGDVVYFKGDEVVKILPHDRSEPWPNCENPDTYDLDSISLTKPSDQCKAHMTKQKILENLQDDPHYYDGLITLYRQRSDELRRQNCKKCNGTGVAHQDIGDWEHEGGACVEPRKEACSECIFEPIKLDADAAARFFNLPIPNQYITLKMSKAGAMCFSISIHVTLNPALQDEAMRQLDALLFDKKNDDWLSNVWGWNVCYKVGISSRSFSGSPKEAQLLLQQWIRNCGTKFGRKNLSTESSL